MKKVNKFGSVPTNVVQKSNGEETYLLKSAQNLLKKEVKKTLSLSSSKNQVMSLFGVRVNGIDPRLVNKAEIQIDIPLQEGKEGRIPTGKKDAKLNIKKNTLARVKLSLGKNEKGILSLNNFSIAFSKPIVIRNPSASLEENSEKHKIRTKIKDKLANVILESISVDNKGDVHITGDIKALRVFEKSIPEKLTSVELPKINEFLLKELGIVEEPQQKGKNKISSLSSKFDVSRLLQNLGAITKTAKYSLHIDGETSEMAFLKQNFYFRGPKKPTSIHIEGTADLNKEGDIHLLVDDKLSKISSSLGTYVPRIDLNLKGVGKKDPLDIELTGTIKGNSESLAVDTYSSKEVKQVLPRRAFKSPVQNPPEREDEFNMAFGAKNTKIDSRFKVHARLGKKLENAHASFDLSASFDKPYIKTQERGGVMDGEIGTYVRAYDFNYSQEKGIGKTRAEINLNIKPNEKVTNLYPEMQTLNLNYSLDMLDSKHARIKPPEFGVARLLSPVKNYEGHKDRVDTKATRKNIYPIGSENYFKQIERVSATKMTTANSVKLLIDGIHSMPERLRIIKNAQKSICFQTLAYKDDESGWEFAKALAEASQRGVKVYAIMDSLANADELSKLSSPNPIYKYLEENGVEIKLYNNFVETGLRKIFSITKLYPSVFDNEKNNSLKSVAQILRFFEQVIESADGENPEISPEDQKILREGIHALMSGKEDVSPQNAINELKSILGDNHSNLREIILAVKRMGDASYLAHEKYLIVDGETESGEVIMGGMNIASEYLQGGSGKMVEIHGKKQPAWRDSDVLLSGPVIKDAYNSFRRNWLTLSQERLPPSIAIKKDKETEGRHKVAVIQHRPLFDGDHNITNFMLYNLRTLKPGEKAWFETAYFLPRGALRALQKEMVLAAKRGVDVRILTNSPESTDFKPLVKAATFDTRQLIEAGARVFHRKDRMVHAKVSLFGDKLCAMGSWNLDNRSASHDSEDIVAIYDEKTNKEMSKQFEIDMFDQSFEVTRESIAKRPLLSELRSAGALLLGEFY
jgi:phosphatidylserine/phosphatidylglycerophosphate/cardiolipin synthase-like enzyme